MKQLDHQTRKTFERPRNAHGRRDFNQNAFGSMDVDLELSCLVDRGIEEGQETLLDSQCELVVQFVVICVPGG